jgi:calcineurin-like phosphoesterase family protein
MYFFTSDEHYGHKKIIEYCNRPFETVEEMDETIISNHNEVVSRGDIVIHGGDFTLWKNVEGIYRNYINRLNGQHVFLKGSHDYWLKGKNNLTRWERNITINGKKYYFVVDHYAGRVWPRSHYNSFQLYGHSHGNLPPVGKQHDIGVDNNNFYPLSENQILMIMERRPDNFNLVRDNSRDALAREGVIKPRTETG